MLKSVIAGSSRGVHELQPVSPLSPVSESVPPESESVPSESVPSESVPPPESTPWL